MRSKFNLLRVVLSLLEKGIAKVKSLFASGLTGETDTRKGSSGGSFVFGGQKCIHYAPFCGVHWQNYRWSAQLR